MTSVTIPGSVTSIGPYAFEDCSSLTSITIPSSVTSIDYGAFDGCCGLISVTIPEGVTSIDDGAFYGCSSLTSVTINCSNVGRWFSQNTSLTEIILGEGVTSIGNRAFANCSGLTSVVIPSSVTSIGESAFYYCSGLTDVYCAATTPPTAYSYSFDDDLSKATLHVYASAVDDYWNTEPWSRFGKIVALTDEEIATDIKEKREEEKSGAGANNPPTGGLRGAFDLNGQRQMSPKRGVHIIGGRKVVVK